MRNDECGMRNAKFPLPNSFRIHHSEFRIMKMITSKSNPRIKEIRLLKQAKPRHARGEYFIEGVRLLEEALHQDVPVRQIAYSPRLEKTERGAELLALARGKTLGAEWLYVSDEILGMIADTQTHQGV